MIRQPHELEASRVLVVAPHPDDEALGCGGLIAALAQKGCRFHVVFTTDGGASHLNSPSWPRARLAALREEEAAEALRRLGIGAEPRSFLRLQDAAMPMRSSAEERQARSALGAILRDLQPDLVLLPWRRDPHCDHRDSWQLTVDALAEACLSPLMLEYAIWLDELGAEEDRPRQNEAERILFDIAPVLAMKRNAVEAHLSQTTDLIDDDPHAFRLSGETIERLVKPAEAYWKPFP